MKLELTVDDTMRIFFFGTAQLSTMETSNLQNKNQNLIKNKEIYKNGTVKSNSSHLFFLTSAESENDGTSEEQQHHNQR